MFDLIIKALNECILLFQLFTEYGRLALEGSKAKPFQVNKLDFCLRCSSVANVFSYLTVHNDFEITSLARGF